MLLTRKLIMLEMFKTTYINEKDRGHNPGKVVGEDLDARLEHTLVVDNMIEKLISLFLIKFL